jgi:hypothetical protein
MEKGIIPVEDRRLVIPESVYLALEDMAAEERKTASEISKPLITPRSTAQHILSVAVGKFQKRGHYVGRKQG